MKSTIEKVIDTNNQILKELSKNDDQIDVVYINSSYYVYKNKMTVEINEYIKRLPFEIRHSIQSINKQDELNASVKLGKNKYKTAIRVGTKYIASIIVDKYGFKSSGEVITDAIDEAALFLDINFPEIPEHMFTNKSIKESVPGSLLSRLISKYDLSPHMIRGEICLYSSGIIKKPDDIDPSIQYMSGLIDEFELTKILCSPYVQASKLLKELELIGIEV